MVNNLTLTPTKYTGVFYRLTKNNDKVFYITYMQNKNIQKKKLVVLKKELPQSMRIKLEQKERLLID